MQIHEVLRCHFANKKKKRKCLTRDKVVTENVEIRV